MNNNAGSGISSGLLSWFDSQFWAIEPSMYETLRSFLVTRATNGGVFTAREEKDAAINAARSDRSSGNYSMPSTNQSGGGGLIISVMSLYGIISPRAGMVADMSQEGCTLDSWLARYKSARLDPNVGATFTLIDSPGGNVVQTAETADEIYALRSVPAVHRANGTKPDVAIIIGSCASAAFWLGAQFGELVCCPTGMVGSIGVRSMFKDVTGADEKEGIKYFPVTSPKGGYKNEGDPHAGMPDEESIAWAQKQSDEFYNMFTGALARGRGVKKSVVQSDWLKGRMATAPMALELGMVDRINTVQAEIDAMVVRIGGGKKNAATTGAQSENPDDRALAAAKFRIHTA